jgi:hypothetical protein
LSKVLLCVVNLPAPSFREPFQTAVAFRFIIIVF